MPAYRRAERVASEIFRVVAEACYSKLSDARLHGLQLTRATVTDDLQIVKLYYFLEGTEEQKKRCLDGLNSAKGLLRSVIASNLSLRIVPEIQFFYDKGMESSERIYELIDSLKTDDPEEKDE